MFSSQNETLAQQEQLCLKEDKEGMLTLKGDRLSCSNPLKVLLDPKNKISHLCLDYQDYQLEFSEWREFLSLIRESCVINLVLEGEHCQIPTEVKDQLAIYQYQNQIKAQNGRFFSVTQSVHFKNNDLLQKDENSMRSSLSPQLDGLQYFYINFSDMHRENSPLNAEKINALFLKLEDLCLLNVKAVEFSGKILIKLSDTDWQSFIKKISQLNLKQLERVYLMVDADAIKSISSTRMIKLISSFNKNQDLKFWMDPTLLTYFSDNELSTLCDALKEISASIEIGSITEVGQWFKCEKEHKVPITLSIHNNVIKTFFEKLISSPISIKSLILYDMDEEQLSQLCPVLKACGIYMLSMEGKRPAISKKMREDIKSILFKNASDFALPKISLKSGILFSMWAAQPEKAISLSKIKKLPEDLQEAYYALPYKHMRM